ncbi:MAG: hypothetical protein ABI600_03850 [Luteolibacter sp.]
MNLRKYTLMGTLAALAAGGAVLAPTQLRASEQGVEELTRGPVHEAFAATVSFDPEPGMFVKTAPPSLIEEVPPEQQLEGNNVTWIPGYWGWDEETTDFIWISGVWRNLPPGRQWVPGYWAEAGNQWQWTSGYWADEAAKEVAYLPKPPKSIESGPNVEAPSRNHIWVSGTWVNREDRYAWRPGYWEPGQENWTWSPSHYQWTPRGYVFIDGYWDYDVARRGVVFAPVRFEHSYYNRPDYIYTPLMVISLNVFVNHLFVRPSYGHYYFGDYYEPRYRNEGFYASYSYRSGRNGYDPIYAQDRWEHRDDRNWERSRREDFDYYRDNKDARPPRTWAALEARPEGKRRGQRDDEQLAMPLKQYAERPTGGQRFQAVSAETRTKMVEQNKEVRKFGRDRQQMETHADAPAAVGKGKQIEAKREQFVKSPVIAKPAEQLSGKDAPPKRRGMKGADLPTGKTASPDGVPPNTTDATKNAIPATKDHRSHNAATDQGKDGKPAGEAGKMTEPATQPDGKRDARPSTKSDTTPSPRTESGTKRHSMDRTQAEPKTTEGKGSQPDASPKRTSADPIQPPKQVNPTESKHRVPTPKMAEPEPRPEQKGATERHQPKAQPEPQRQVQPQPQPRVQRAPEPQRQQPKAQPEPQRQVQPQRSPEPERRQHRAQPEPQRQAPAPQQPKAEKAPSGSKKSTDEETDPSSSHRRN